MSHVLVARTHDGRSVRPLTVVAVGSAMHCRRVERQLLFPPAGCYPAWPRGPYWVEPVGGRLSAADCGSRQLAAGDRIEALAAADDGGAS